MGPTLILPCGSTRGRGRPPASLKAAPPHPRSSRMNAGESGSSSGASRRSMARRARSSCSSRPAGHYYTQAVTMEGLATGRGDLLIEGDRWTYSSKSKQDGKDVFHRTTNRFSGTNRIHFEQAESPDGEHWVVKMSGDEQRVEPAKQ